MCPPLCVGLGHGLNRGLIVVHITVHLLAYTCLLMHVLMHLLMHLLGVQMEMIEDALGAQIKVISLPFLVFPLPFSEPFSPSHLE